MHDPLMTTEAAPPPLHLRPEGHLEISSHGSHEANRREFAEGLYRPRGSPSASQRRIFGDSWSGHYDLADLLAVAEPERWGKRADRLLSCCEYPRAVARADGRCQLSLGRCRDRMCSTCSRIRARQTAARIRDAVGRMDSPRFLTLTLRSEPDDTLPHLLNRLRKSLSAFRRTSAWKSHVVGGVYCIETKLGRDDRWHPHVHMVIDGSFWRQSEISAGWLEATGDSSIVDIRKITSKTSVARYIAKYISKGPEFDSWADGAKLEYADAMYRQRTLGTFGNLHNVRLDDDTQDEVPSKAVAHVSLSKLRYYADRKHRRACRLLDRLADQGAAWRMAAGLLFEYREVHPVRCTPERRRRLCTIIEWFHESDAATIEAQDEPDPPPKLGIDPPITLPLADWLDGPAWMT